MKFMPSPVTELAQCDNLDDPSSVLKKEFVSGTLKRPHSAPISFKLLAQKQQVRLKARVHPLQHDSSVRVRDLSQYTRSDSPASCRLADDLPDIDSPIRIEDKSDAQHRPHSSASNVQCSPLQKKKTISTRIQPMKHPERMEHLQTQVLLEVREINKKLTP